MPTARKLQGPGQVTAPVPLAPQTLDVRIPEGVGAGLGRVASGLGGAALSQARQIESDEIDRQNRVAVNAAERQLAQWEIENLHGENGALRRQGRNAFDIVAEYGDAFTRYRGEVRNGLSNDTQRAAFDELASNRELDLTEALTRHSQTQIRAYDDEEFQAGLEAHAQLAVRNAGNDRRIASELARMEDLILEYSESYGLGPEWTREQISVWESQAHEGVISQLLADGQEADARTYFEANLDDIRADRLDDLTRAVAAGTLRGQAQEETDRIMDLGLSRTRALEEARALTDPEVRDEVRQRVELRYNEQERAMEEEERRQAESGYRAIEGAGSVNEMLRIRDSLPTLAMRRNADAIIEDRTTGRDRDTDQRRWYELRTMAANDPDRFMGLNLYEDFAKLSDADFQELANLQGSLIRGDREAAERVLGGIRSNERIISSTLEQVGIDPRGNPEAVSQLWNEVDARVRQLQSLTGRPVTDEDIQGIVDEELMRRDVERPGTWMGLFTRAPFFDTTGPAAEVTPQQVIDSEDLTLLPLPVRRELEAMIRQRGELVNDASLLEELRRQMTPPVTRLRPEPAH